MALPTPKQWLQDAIIIVRYPDKLLSHMGSIFIQTYIATDKILAGQEIR